MLNTECAIPARYYGRLVYCSVLYIGNIPKSGSKTIEHGLDIDSVLVCAAHGDDGCSFPYMYLPDTITNVQCTSTYLEVNCIGRTAEGGNLYAIVFYVKP